MLPPHSYVSILFIVSFYRLKQNVFLGRFYAFFESQIDLTVEYSVLLYWSFNVFLLSKILSAKPKTKKRHLQKPLRKGVFGDTLMYQIPFVFKLNMLICNAFDSLLEISKNAL